MSKNGEYDRAWGADHEKECFSSLKKSIFEIEIFRSESEEKKMSLKLENKTF